MFGELRRDYAELEKFPVAADSEKKIKTTLHLIEQEIVRLEKNSCNSPTPESVWILSRKILGEVKTLQTVREETEN